MRVRLRKYRSFSEPDFWINEPKKLNFVIGKNNSGKSNILKAINELSGNADQEYQHGKFYEDAERPSVDLEVSRDDLGMNHNSFTHGELRDKNKKFFVRYNYSEDSLKIPEQPEYIDSISEAFRHVANDPDSLVNNYRNKARELIKGIFGSTLFVPQFRELREHVNTGGKYNELENIAGYGLAETLAKMKSPRPDEEFKRQKFLEVQKWIAALLELDELEIDFEDVTSERPRELILRTSHRRAYLETYGTGIHQLVLLCFAISLKTNHLICIEEPEIFLHPTLQRRFIQFLRKTDNKYFIATHSNVLLDQAEYEDTEVYHITHDGYASDGTHVQTSEDTYKILDDLGYHSSDIMQANGIIWVEGPTDRTYLIKWLELFNPELKEGIHYSIMFYGGRLASHIAISKNSTSHLIPLLRLNRNIIFTMD